VGWLVDLTFKNPHHRVFHYLALDVVRIESFGQFRPRHVLKMGALTEDPRHAINQPVDGRIDGRPVLAIVFGQLRGIEHLLVDYKSGDNNPWETTCSFTRQGKNFLSCECEGDAISPGL
jgi:hypothetical protein